MTREPGTGAGLEAFFDAARDDTALPPGDLMARIEADALSALPAPARRPSVWAGLWRALGGWPAAAGLAAAACAGVWIGFAPPDTMLALWQGDAAFSALDPVSSYDFAMVDG